MFGLFSKKNKELKVIDQIYLSDDAKFKACLAIKKANPDSIFIAWFEETKIKLTEYFLANKIEEQIYLANYLSTSLASKSFIFIEHHPLRVEEQKKAEELGKDQIIVLSALTEPIFQIFSGDKIISLMHQMGIQEDEMIEHNMISNSIKRAQDYVASKTLINGAAKSQADWLLNAGLNQNAT